MLFLIICNYDFALVLFSYRNYSIQNLCTQEIYKRSSLYFTRIFLFSIFSMNFKPLPEYITFIFGLFNIRWWFPLISTSSKICLLLLNLNAALSTALGQTKFFMTLFLTKMQFRLLGICTVTLLYSKVHVLIALPI